MARFFNMKSAIRLSSLLLFAGLSSCAGSIDDAEAPAYAGPQPRPSPLVKWPAATGDKPVSQTIKVSGVLDGGLKRYYGAGDLSLLGSGDKEEKPGALFELEDGATLSNVILGETAGEGVRCKGSCTLNNVWWERAGDGAATFAGTSDSALVTVNGGGASGAFDKVFAHNGAGTLLVKNFYAEWFGKIYRSCGNCSKQYGRKVVFENLTAVTGPKASAIAGINSNLGDHVEFQGVNTIYAMSKKVPACVRYEGNTNGGESKKLGAGPDGTSCKYDDTTVVTKN
ncbi:MAG TPA: pectate lyase [Polyangiaceae bacterium]|jgi:hypothetical protein